MLQMFRVVLSVEGQAAALGKRALRVMALLGKEIVVEMQGLQVEVPPQVAVVAQEQ
jgi:hypothetical protein